MCIRDRIRNVQELMEAARQRSDTVSVGNCGLGSIPHVGLCLLYTSDAADERSSVDLGGRRIIKKKKTRNNRRSVWWTMNIMSTYHSRRSGKEG